MTRTTDATPVASIVVPSYKGVERLPRLFEALATQESSSPSFEVVVVVDGVDDGTPALVEEESRFAVRAVVFPQNRGRVAALNAGFGAAQGEVLIRCDDDLVPGPRYILNHVAAHAQGPVGVIGMYKNVYDPSPYSRAYGDEADANMRDMARNTGPRMSWRFWAGNCSVTRETWERVGQYDPDYRLYGWEDVDYGYRLYEAGIRIAIAPELETPHMIAATTTKIRVARAFHAAAARRIFERKHPAAPLSAAIPEWSVWNGTVRALSRVMALVQPPRIGGTVDRIIPLLPRAVSRRLIAACVEAAAVAGYRAPLSAKDVF